MLSLAVLCLFVVLPIAIPVAGLIILGSGPIPPYALIVLSAWAFYIGLIARGEFATWQSRIRRSSDDAGSYRHWGE